MSDEHEEHKELRELREWQRNPTEAKAKVRRRKASPEAVERAAAARAAAAEERRRLQVRWDAEKYRLESLSVAELVAELKARTRAFVFLGVSGNPEQSHIFLEGQDFALAEAISVFKLVCREAPTGPSWISGDKEYFGAHYWTRDFTSKTAALEAYKCDATYPGIHLLNALDQRFEMGWGVINSGQYFSFALTKYGDGRKLPAVGCSKAGAGEVAWAKVLAEYRKRLPADEDEA